MQHQSWPSGAPTRAAVANAAVTPGTTCTSIDCQSTGASSADCASKTADAMAKTPGSPDETTTTRRPEQASASAWRARPSSAPLSEPCSLGLARHSGGSMSRYVWYPTRSVAWEITSHASGRSQLGFPGPRPTTASQPAGPGSGACVTYGQP